METNKVLKKEHYLIRQDILYKYIFKYRTKIKLQKQISKLLILITKAAW